MTPLIAPHGGALTECLLGPNEANEEKKAAKDYLSWDLTRRQLCDLELLLNGGFAPLEGFMGEEDYETVVKKMRLADGTLWPIPVTLNVSESFAEKLSRGAKIALRDPEGVLIAVMEVSAIFATDRHHEAELVYGAENLFDPGWDDLLNRARPVCVGGKVRGIEAPSHYDFKHLRHTPRSFRNLFERLGWSRIIAFQPRHPMELVFHEPLMEAAEKAEANLLIHPIVGMAQPEEIDRYYSKICCYEELLRRFPEGKALLSLAPLATRGRRDREALWHAIIHQNYGCTHFVMGRKVGVGKSGREIFDSLDDSIALAHQYQGELGIRLIPPQEMGMVKERMGSPLSQRIESDQKTFNIPSGDLLSPLQEEFEIPEGALSPDVSDVLRKVFPPKDKQGFTIFFTGLSGAGKSTISRALMVKLLEMGERSITLLDGDIVRKHLSSELGFSKEHRDIHILRLGFVASEITKHGGVAICAPIAPYRQTRLKVREMIARWGGFIEVFVATPLGVCESRDRKGLYAKARGGLIKGFTGIDDPYEAPEAPELTIDTQDCSPEEAAEKVLLKLNQLGYMAWP